MGQLFEGRIPSLCRVWKQIYSLSGRDHAPSTKMGRSIWKSYLRAKFTTCFEFLQVPGLRKLCQVGLQANAQYKKHSDQSGKVICRTNSRRTLGAGGCQLSACNAAPSHKKLSDPSGKVFCGENSQRFLSSCGWQASQI